MSLERVEAVVLGTVKHSDRSNILSVYTSDRGRMSFVVSAAKGRSANAGRARTQPLSIVEITYRPSLTGDLHRASSIALKYVYGNLYCHPVKNAVGMFVAEFLSRVLRDTVPDTSTYDFIARSLMILDRLKRGVSNFHIAFLTAFSAFAGIHPDTSGYREGRVFDMQAGQFVDVLPLHKDWLDARDSRFLMLLSRITYANMHRFRFTGRQRSQILEMMLRYYAIHLPGVSRMRSPAVLAEVFSTGDD